MMENWVIKGAEKVALIAGIYATSLLNLFIALFRSMRERPARGKYFGGKT